MFNKRLVWTLGLLAMQAARGQDATTGTVSGFVLDSQTGRPVVGAVVAVKGDGAPKTVADSAGKYAIVLAPGKYQLTIAAANYFTVNLTEGHHQGGRDRGSQYRHGEQGGFDHGRRGGVGLGCRGDPRKRYCRNGNSRLW